MGFSRQEYWSGLPFPPPGDFPDPAMEPMSLTSPALADRFFTASATWEPQRGLRASAWWLSEEESTCHRRRRGFDSWSGKIPRTVLEPKPVHHSVEPGSVPRIRELVASSCSQVVVKKVSTQHRWYLENTSCDRESCWKEKILLSARGFSVFFQMLVKARKVGKNFSLPRLSWCFVSDCRY